MRGIAATGMLIDKKMRSKENPVVINPENDV